MKKKRIFENEMEVLRDIDYIEKNLTYILDIDTVSNICIDPDNKQTIKIDGKCICYPKDAFGDNFENNKTIMKFEPFMNKRLALALFQRYIIQIFPLDNPNCQIMGYFTANNALERNRILTVCKTYTGDITSRSFINETVSWIDLILKMDNQQLDYQRMVRIDDYIEYLKTVEA